MKVCVLGLGNVGIPTASYILKRRIETWGYDISEAAVDRAKRNGIRATTNWHEIPSADIYLVVVSTLLKNKAPMLTPVFDACKKITEKAKPTSLISIESSVIPGTSRKIYINILKKRFALVHVPHRYWAGDPVKHGVKQLRVIGAINNESLGRGVSFYRKQLEIPLYLAPSIEVAEMSKIAENAYRYVQIAFAEELRMICEQTGLEYEEMRKACNTKWNIEILGARDGIKGSCLPKDIRYLSSLSPQNILLKSAISVDEAYRNWLASNKNTRSSRRPGIGGY